MSAYTKEEGRQIDGRHARAHLARGGERICCERIFRGRLETICSAARVNIRMIYPYFGDREGLYIAVLEETLSGLRKEELKLAFDNVAPIEAILQLFEFTYEHFAANPR